MCFGMRSTRGGLADPHPVSAGKLVLCGTPIGNLEDVTCRLLRTLERADLIACEDPKRTRKLLSHHGVGGKEMLVYNEGNERRRVRQILDRIAAGAVVA